MKTAVIKTTLILAFSIPVFLLAACTTTIKTPTLLSSSFDPAAIHTLGIYPVTYDPRYEEPLDVKLSAMIVHAAEKQLQSKGYRTVILDQKLLLPEGGKVTPAALKADSVKARLPEGIDALVAIHVRSHFGIAQIDRTTDIIMGPQININGEAGLISADTAEKLWHDNGIGRSFGRSIFLRHTQFLLNLRQAARDFTKSLFTTLPPKTD